MRIFLPLFAAFVVSAGAVSACPPAPACYERGVAAFIEEDYKVSGEAFESAVNAEPDNADYRLWLGRAWGRKAERATGFARMGALSLAKKVRDEFIQAIELDSKNVKALQALFRYYVNAPGIAGGGLDKAEPLIARIAALDKAAGLRAQAEFSEHSNDFAAAEKALREAVRLEPDELGHKLSLASFLSRRGEYEESDRIFAAAPDKPDVWFSRGKALVRSGRSPAEARKLLERYLATPLAYPEAEPYSNARGLLKEL